MTMIDIADIKLNALNPTSKCFTEKFIVTVRSPKKIILMYFVHFLLSRPSIGEDAKKCSFARHYQS